MKFIQQKKDKKGSLGFTLVEILIVMSVLGVLSGVAGLILSSTLSTTNKTKVLTNVRQNGNFVLLQVGKSIQYAKSFEGVSSTDTADTSFSTTCINAAQQYKYVKITQFYQCTGATCGATTYGCQTVSGVETIASNGASLLDTSSVAVVPSSCYFTCRRDAITDNPQITINFTLAQKNSLALFENTAAVEFHTSALMRNLQR